MFRIFPKFDPRLKADLLLQWRPLLTALLCVALTGLLSASMIYLIREATKDIQIAAGARTVSNPIEQIYGQDNTFYNEIAQELGVPPNTVSNAVQRVEDKHNAANRRKALADGTRQQALNHLALISLLVVGAYFIKYWCTRGAMYYFSKAANLLGNGLRKRVFERLQQLPIAYFNRKRAGAIQSVLTNDVNVYYNAAMVVRDSVDGPIKIITGLGAVLIISPLLAGIAAIFVPIIASVVQLNSRRTKKASATLQEDTAELQAFTQETVQGTRVIKAFAAEAHVMASFQSKLDRFFESQMRLVRRISSLKPAIEFVGAIALAIIIYLCGWLASGNHLKIEDVTALVWALDQVNQGWRALGYVRNTFAQVEASTDRIYNEVLDVPLESESDRNTAIPPDFSGEIEFRNVHFTYPDGTEALHGVTFKIPAGTSLALVGPSGAGKSTIADLLLKFYAPTSGAVLLDGRDLQNIDTQWLRRQIGVVPQSTFLFAGSLTENIRLGNPNATEAEVKLAAQAAHVQPFADRLPQQYDTPLGEQGAGLSGGEKQRLAIARALVRSPKILLMDEATSNLDAESEKAVTEALADVMPGKSTLFIAHRLTTAARADRILVLRRGEVLETGSHRELMDANGAYAGMYRAFSSGLLGEEL